MRKVATYGRGNHLVRFCFFDRKPTKKFPIELELVNVNIKCRTRSEVGKVLRRYHSAELTIRQNPYQYCPKYGFRYIAKRYPTADVYTTDKRGEPLHFIKYFCYHFKGFLPERLKRYATINFGYQEC